MDNEFLPFIVKLIVLFSSTGVGLWVYAKFLKNRQKNLCTQFRFRDAESSRDFLVACGISSLDSDQARIALKIREVMAELGDVPVQLLHAKDRFDRELEPLPFCQQFYVADFADRLTSKTGLKLNREQLELPHPDVPPHGMTLADFVRCVLSTVGLIA